MILVSGGRGRARRDRAGEENQCHPNAVASAFLKTRLRDRGFPEHIREHRAACRNLGPTPEPLYPRTRVLVRRTGLARPRGPSKPLDRTTRTPTKGGTLERPTERPAADST
jgi:hypothetical protein